MGMLVCPPKALWHVIECFDIVKVCSGISFHCKLKGTELTDLLLHRIFVSK